MIVYLSFPEVNISVTERSGEEGRRVEFAANEGAVLLLEVAVMEVGEFYGVWMKRVEGAQHRRKG